jgi:UDP:flavonoid glycosyltransferase YjiC (YdhE family)
MTKRLVACIVADPSYFHTTLPVLDELRRAGAVVRVWTALRLRNDILAIDCEFSDLFADFPLELSDSSSSPFPMRFIAFAADRAESLSAEVKAWGASLILQGSFALVAKLVAQKLDLPYVALTFGHAADSIAFRRKLVTDPRVSVSTQCALAVERIRAEYGVPDVTPFSYVSDPSPWLNIYREPSEWLTEDESKRLGPIAYFGSLPKEAIQSGETLATRNGPLRIYASFGTIVWKYWAEVASAAMLAISEAVASRPGQTLTIGLGGGAIAPLARRIIEQRGAIVLDYANQLAALNSSDVFITHNGLSSTHEAVACAVPMLSLPFFWDQPKLAKRCEELGLAIPMISGVAVGQELHPDMVRSGLARIDMDHSQVRVRLLEARQWEKRTIAGRSQVAQQILRLGL